MALGTADDCLDPRDQLAAIERFGQEIVGADAETFDLVVEFGEARKDQDRRLHARRPQPAQHLVSVDIRQHQIKNDDVVIVQLADFQTVFAEIGRVANKVLPSQHHLDAFRGGGIILDEKHAHQGLRGTAGNLKLAGLWLIGTLGC